MIEVLKTHRIPEKMERFCITCQRMTLFKKDPDAFHNNCEVCGGSDSLLAAPQGTFRDELFEGLFDEPL